MRKKLDLNEKTAFSLDGEVALVTGGATGLGFAIASTLVASGANVVIAGRRKAELDGAVKELGPRAGRRVYDVTEFQKAESLIRDVEDAHGPLSILVNNAGNTLKKPAEDVTEEEYLNVLNVHVVGAHALSRHAAKSMGRRRRGHIIFTASMASWIGLPFVTAYCAAKSAHLGMVRSLSVEWADKSIRVNAVLPGWIESDITRQAFDADPERKARVLQRTPMHRLGEAEDVGWAVAYLCSPAARFITGACLPVDGGLSIGF